MEGSATAERELARLRRSGDRPPLGSQEDAPVDFTPGISAYAFTFG